MEGFSFTMKTQEYEVAPLKFKVFKTIISKLELGYQLLLDNKGKEIVVIDPDKLETHLEQLSENILIKEVVKDIFKNKDEDCDLIFIVPYEVK